MTDVDRLTGALAGRYTVEREIGHGGMATVYLAHDAKHDRKVAIKVLHDNVAAAIGPDRFLNEILVAARFSHPNILGLIDSGRVDLGSAFPTPYYVMPYVDGESLRDRLIREGHLPLSDALRIAREVADALAYAHAHGVVHRDIKPENILLSGGHALVADFGIAKAVLTAGDKHLTTQGMIVGTPAYMSPEQASGERALDGRVDVYALGCVLYEMLAGVHPFDAPTPQTMLVRAMTERPRPLHVVRPAIPQALDAVVVRALERVPADRHASAADFARDLDAARETGLPVRRRGPWRVLATIGIPSALVLALGFVALNRLHPGAGSTASRAIVVLPFANTGADRGDEYFSDGMTDELAAALAKVPGLRVAARSSAYQFKGQNIDVHEIGRRLAVGAVVEGSVRRSGDTVHVTAQLVNVADGLALWSDTYDRDVKGVFTIQNQIAASIARALRLSVGGTGQLGAGTTNLEAHDLFLRGRYFWNQRNQEGFNKAVEYFGRAIARDSGYAQAWAGLGDAYSLLGGFGYMAPTDAYGRARAAANRALALDSTLADAYTALGFIHLFYDWDWNAARDRLDRALVLDPRYGEGRLFHAWYLVAVNRLDDAITELRGAVADEPVSLILNTRLATMLMLAGRYDEAVAQFRRVFELDPDYALAHLDLARVQAGRGDYGAALSELQHSPELVGSYGLGAKGFVLARAGRREEAITQIMRLQADTAHRYSVALAIAQIYGALGDHDRAFQWLDRAYTDRNWPLYFCRADPLLEPLRGDPRWGAFVQRMNFP